MNIYAVPTLLQLLLYWIIGIVAWMWLVLPLIFLLDDTSADDVVLTTFVFAMIGLPPVILAIGTIGVLFSLRSGQEVRLKRFRVVATSALVLPCIPYLLMVIPLGIELFRTAPQ